MLQQDQAARREVAQAVNRINSLQSIAATLTGAITPSEVAEIIVETGKAAVDAQGGTVHLVAKHQQGLELVYAASHAEERVDNRWLPMDLRAPCVEVVKTAEPIWVNSKDDLINRYPDLADRPAPSYAAFASLPLMVREDVIGVFCLRFDEPCHFPAADQEFLLTLARLGAQALDRARLYEEEQRARARAEAAVRMRDHFISVAAHELRTPLAVLYGQAQLLQRRMESDTPSSGERNRRSVEAIVTQAERLNRMINALLDIGRIDQGRLTLDRGPTDLTALVKTVTANITPTLTRHTITIETPDHPVLVNGDAVRLEQVLHNLISNGVKYNPNGGEVRVVLTQEDQRARLAVIDQGVGIPMEAQRHIFSRFYRAPNTAQLSISGTGIGLFMVNQIVTLHGGMVAVESREGEGSTFTIWLPLQGERA